MSGIDGFTVSGVRVNLCICDKDSVHDVITSNCGAYDLCDSE